MIKFEVGKTYTTRSACDYDCIFSVTIEKRTGKTVTTTVEGRGRKTLKVGEHDGSEFIKPFGSYSMAPVIRATEQ